MQIHCPNCHYEGKAKEKHDGCLQLVLLGILTLLSFVFPPLFLLVIILLVVFVVRGSNKICPKCKWDHPIPLKHYRAQQAKESS
jgi:hypothetical protein